MAAVESTERGRERGVYVVVADGDAKARTLTTALLRSVGFDVLEAETGAEVLELTRARRPAAVLLDVALPEINGYQVCHMLRAEHGTKLTIILLSTNRTESYDKAAGLLLGADDYIAKPFAPDELLARIEAHMRASGPRPNGNGIASTLTPSELRVLRLLALGEHTKAIARELSVTPKTVAMHINNAMKKLDVHTRTQAVALAHQLGLVESGGDRRASAQHRDVQAHALAPPRRRRGRPGPTA
jgi:DNA-binding NarL/FixJ family response regulator